MEPYTHLSSEERAVIMIERRPNKSRRSIAVLLNRSISTICREISLQTSNQAYCATAAAKNYAHNRTRGVKPCKLTPGSWLWSHVSDKLRFLRWSPEQICRTLKGMYPDDLTKHVSVETVYAAIYAYSRNELKKLYISALRQKKPKRGAKRSSHPGGVIQVPEAQTIHCRAEEINQRLVAGHWEGDLLVGAMNQSCIGTLVERQTGFVILCKMLGKDAQSVREGFERQLSKISQFLRLSMTYDRGSEMAQHPLMSRNLKLDIYFADPHSPWQRGSNENMNGLLRQFLPKSTDLSGVSQTKLNDIAWLLNTRPRKRFNFVTPQVLMDQVIADHLKSVALES